MTTASWHATGQRSNQLHDEGCGRGRTSRILWRRKGAREDEVSRPPTRNPEFLHELEGSRDRAIARSNGSQMCEIRFKKKHFQKNKNQTMVQKPVPPRVAGLRHQLPPLLRTGARRRRFYGEERGTGEAEYQGAAVVTTASGSDNSLIR